MNALLPHQAESPTLRLVGLFRHGKLLSVERAKQFDALISLALRQRKIYWQYRGWAKEAEERGDLPYYRKCADECRRLWRGAKWHLARARMLVE